ncbi:hypothetical protein MSAN_01806500 [Mycena sanguinolenta]|uniref:Uncharacterized protein n=1 Tax=Mycena sanguinolenta TaxID=230812 RepID=A0A8H6XUL5_9AGAR|nr:hypothetical protein MSAN_01806500 [Mycena sanguinolenta]
MVRPGFGLLALALAIAHPRHIAAIPALVTLPVLPFGDPSGSPLTAIEFGVDSQSGYTTYGVEEFVLEEGPSTTVTFPFTATVVAGSDHVAITASFSATNLGVVQGSECDLSSRSAICREPQLFTTETVHLSSLVPWVIDVVSTGVPSATPTTNSSPRQVAASIYGVLVGVVLTACTLL